MSTEENYNHVLSKVLGAHKRSGGHGGHKHLGNYNHPIVMLGASSKPIKTLSGFNVGSDRGGRNTRIEELIADFT